MTGAFLAKARPAVSSRRRPDRRHHPPAAGVLALAVWAGMAPAGSAEPAAASPCDIPELRAQMLRMVNEWRAQPRQCGSAGAFAAAPPLSWRDALARAAAQHAADMVRRNVLTHEGRDGSGPAARVQAQGYLWSRVAENVAGGQPTVAAAVQGWQRSAGHCANLMQHELQHLGAACMRGTATRYGLYWALVLAAPQQHQ